MGADEGWRRCHQWDNAQFPVAQQVDVGHWVWSSPSQLLVWSTPWHNVTGLPGVGDLSLCLLTPQSDEGVVVSHGSAAHGRGTWSGRSPWGRCLSPVRHRVSHCPPPVVSPVLCLGLAIAPGSSASTLLLSGHPSSVSGSCWRTLMQIF